ncbi:MAG: shikimate kinase [Verrucomicrobiota bacterium]|jgi:shikimate kinase
MESFRNIEACGDELRKRLGSAIQSDASGKKNASLWFSWPSMASLTQKNETNDRITRFREWSGYGAIRQRLMPANATIGNTLNDWVAIFGQSLVGKSKVGLYLRNELGLRAYDTDEIIEYRLKLSVSECFSIWGESVFREMEARVLMDILDCDPGLVILGGGSLQGAVSRTILKPISHRIFLEGDFGVIWNRLSAPSVRSSDFCKDFSSLTGADQQFFGVIWNLRQKEFESWATMRVCCGPRGISAIGDEVHQLLKNQQLCRL